MAQKYFSNIVSTKWHVILVMGIGLISLLMSSFVVQLELPQPTGVYPVGRVTRNWIDTSRPETLTEASDDFREVPVVIWYPAKAGTGSSDSYIPNLGQVASSLSASGEVNTLQVLGLRFVRSHEYLDASLANSIDTYPVILLSPGNGTNVEFYAAIADELASHGYFVVGINHPYDVAAVALHDDRVAQFMNGPFEFQAHEKWIRERIAVRTADVLFVLDQLHRLNVEGDKLLSGHLDLKRVGVMGHSLGGINAAESCRATLQLRACLNLDGLQQGGPFSADAHPLPPEQPFMMITKERTLQPSIMALFAATQSGSYRVVIHGANHDNFTDGPLLEPSLLPLPNQADRFLNLIRAYSLAFFEQALNENPSQLLSKPMQSELVWLEIFPRKN